MKHKLKVYLDTSVISALFDERNPERAYCKKKNKRYCENDK